MLLAFLVFTASVLSALATGHKDLRYGNSLLADITVVKDFKDKNGEVVYSDQKIDAELLDPATENPKLVVCPRAPLAVLSAARATPSPQ